MMKKIVHFFIHSNCSLFAFIVESCWTSAAFVSHCP